MKEIRIAKAQPMPGLDVESTTIYVNQPLPSTNRETFSLEELDKAFERDADALFQALRQSIPGGTMERLLIKILDWRKNFYTRAG